MWLIASALAVEPEIISVMLFNEEHTAVHVTDIRVEGDPSVTVTEGTRGELAPGAKLVVSMTWVPNGDARPMVTLVVNATEGETRVPIRMRLRSDPLPLASDSDEGPPTGLLTAFGSLPKQEIDAVIKANMAAIRTCYTTRLKEIRGLEGKLTVKFVIAADGTVASAIEKSSTLDDAPMSACVCDVFRGLHFPEPHGHGIVIVSYPFIFTPG